MNIRNNNYISLESICCTCLSVDRKLKQLCKISDGANFLFFLMSYDSVAYEALLHTPVTSMYICWECEAQLKTLCKFKAQASKSHKMLSALIDRVTDVQSIQSFSQLSYNCQNTYNFVYNYEDSFSDNFVDCGLDIIKLEPSLNTSQEITIKPIEKKGKPLLEITPLKINKTSDTIQLNTNKNLINHDGEKKYYSIIHISDQDMDERIEKRRSEKSFVTAQYKCNTCVLVFKNEKEFNIHNTKLHVQKPRHMQCHVCKIYLSHGRLALHESYHRSVYECSICGSVLNVDEMIKHLKAHFVPLHALDKLLRTSHLLNPPLKSKNRKKLNKIIQSYPCTDCDKCFEKQYLRYKHILQCHREGFKCDTCGKRFTYKNTLIKHIQIHGPTQPRQECAICHKMVRTDRMKVHSFIHTDRPKHYCATCNKCFVSSDSYEKHRRNSRAHAVHDVHKHKCSYCTKGFRTLTTLNDHINYNHMGKTEYKCPVCNKALATRRGVTRHIERAHMGKKENTGDKILCQVCGKAFGDKKCLLEHELIHSDEKPLSCEVCGRRFRQSACLYTHRRRVHNVPLKRRVVLINDIK